MVRHLAKLTLAFFVLGGCAHNGPWHYQEMASCAPEYKSSKLTLAPSNLYNGIGIELIKGVSTTRGFFNVQTGQMASEEGVLWINDQPICFKGTLMEGGQRLLLPHAITRDIIKALSDGHQVTASVQGYVTALDADAFQATLQHKEFAIIR